MIEEALQGFEHWGKLKKTVDHNIEHLQITMKKRTVRPKHNLVWVTVVENTVGS